MNVKVAAILLVLALVPGAAIASTAVKAWSDFDTQGLGTSVLFDIGQPGAWSIGPLFSWADNHDLGGDDQWSLGLQCEMQVDPNASVAIADWLGSIGTSVGLPSTLTMRTYVVGEAKVMGLFASGDTNVETVFAIGPGVGVGPIFLECVYQLVNGGGIPALDLESGPVLRFGAVIKF